MSSPDTPPCPLCGRALTDPCAVHVCHGCHANVIGSGNIRVASTGEFRVDQILAAAEELGGGAPAAASGVGCSWCGKPAEEVRKLLSRGVVHICDECVALCSAVMQAELGDDWR